MVNGVGTSRAFVRSLLERFEVDLRFVFRHQPEAFNQVVPEESGGPFVETSAGTEFAGGTDESNIEEATREPFPTT